MLSAWLLHFGRAHTASCGHYEIMTGPAASHSTSSLDLGWVGARQEVRMPPGPRGRVIPNLRLIREPIEALRDWSAEFGHTFTVNRLGVPTVMTADPELIGQIYGARDPELFDAVVPGSLDVLLGSNSLLMLSGRRHQHERKLMTPPFHGERMRGWAGAMAEAARRAFAGSGEIRAAERTQEATLEVIVRVVFGVQDETRVAEFMAAINVWTNAVRSGFLFVRALQRDVFGLSAFARYRRALERVDALLLDQIARTRAKPGGSDVLSGLVEARYDDGSAMDDLTIRDHLRTLLFAGHETTATILAWALYFVHRDPAILAKLGDELASLGPDAAPELLTRLPYLNAIVDETLRIRPITVDTHRLLRKPWQLGEWQLPAGSAVCAATTLLHHRADLWPEPEQFRPERFVDGRPDPNTFIPFGGGAHRCLGATFAKFEAAVVLGTVLRECRLELLDEDVRWVRGRGTLQPLSGVRMQVA